MGPQLGFTAFSKLFLLYDHTRADFHGIKKAWREKDKNKDPTAAPEPHWDVYAKAHSCPITQPKYPTGPLRFTGLEEAKVGIPAAPTAALPLTLEHYAAMICELNKKAGQDEAVLKRYGMATEADRVRVMRVMGTYLMLDPLEKTKFDMLLQRFAAWSK